jgi:hypothetical protein
MGTIFRLSRSIMVEFFDDGTLVLDLRDNRSTQVDAQESCLLRHLHNQAAESDFVPIFRKEFKLTQDRAKESVQAACERLIKRRVLQVLKYPDKGPIKNMITKFMQNPVVNIREEDADGLLLYNPDTDQVKLLNDSGVFIWKLLAEQRTMVEITAAFHENFENLPDHLDQDIEEYLDQMVKNQFITIVDAL